MKFFKSPITAFFLGIIVIVCVAADVTSNVRYRQGAVVSFDTTATIQDENANWSIDNNHLNRLSKMQGFVLTNGAAGGLVTNAFVHTFTIAPALALGGAIGVSPYISFVTTTNFAVGSTYSNAVINVICFGK